MIPYIRIYIIGPYRHEKFFAELKNSHCEYSYNNSSITRIMKVEYIQSPTFDWNNPKAGSIHFYVYCNIPSVIKHEDVEEQQLEYPFSVSLNMGEKVSRLWKADLEGRRRKFLIPIQQKELFHTMSHNRRHTLSRKFLAYCAKPFLGNWASLKNNGYFEPTALLINFLLYYTNSGVEHFTFYDQGTATARIYYIISIAREAGVSIEVLPWNYRERHGYGMFQTVSIETCIHRHLSTFENVIVGDFDELIVPKTADSLTNLVRNLDKQYPTASHFKFRSANFYTFIPNTPSILLRPDTSTSKDTPHNLLPQLLMFQKCNRSVPYSFSRGTKCIVKPGRISEAGIHDATPLNNSYQTVEVDFDTAGVHHYRDAIVDTREPEVTDIVDTTILKFSQTVMTSKLYNLFKAKKLI